MDVERAIEDLDAFRGGFIDTSTLIYLEKIGMLEVVAMSFTLKVIPQVWREYGSRLPEPVQLVEAVSGETDSVLLQAALGERAAILSEDRRVLKMASRLKLVHLNALMVLLALVRQDRIAWSLYRESLMKLQKVARYDKVVWRFGRLLLERISPADSRDEGYGIQGYS